MGLMQSALGSSVLSAGETLQTSLSVTGFSGGKVLNFPLKFFVGAGKTGAGKCSALILFLAKITGTALLLFVFKVKIIKS